MKPEQRLLIALGLTLGILLFWTTFFPPPKESAEQAARQKITALSDTFPPKLVPLVGLIQRCSIGSLLADIGTVGGGIQALQVGGIKLLEDENAGLFYIELVDSNGEKIPVSFENKCEKTALVSQTQSDLNGLEIKRIISISDDQHPFLWKVRLEVKNKSPKKTRYQIRLVTYRPLYSSVALDQRYRDGLVSVDEKIRHLRVRSGQTLQFASVEWITSQGKSTVLIIKPFKPEGMFHVEQAVHSQPIGWLALQTPELAFGESSLWDFLFYAGPLSLQDIKASGLEECVSFGTFSGISKFLLTILEWVHGWTHNYGTSIFLLSFGIWLIFFPVTWSGIRMMKVMAQIQPQMERLRKEHEKNPQKLNQEILALYRKYRVNPVTGCLPLFFQMPIFIALYQVLARSPQLRNAQFFWIRDLSSPDAVIQFAQPLPLLGKNLNLLPILMSVSMFVQQQMTRSNSAVMSEDQKVQQAVFRWFPLLFGFLFYQLPSGLVLYWVSNTLLTIGQQLLYRGVYRNEF